MEDALSKARAVVVPLRIGSGTRLKILEAWAYGLPVVSTRGGAEGLPALDEDNALLADSVPALAEACIRVLTDDALCSRLASAGRRTAETSFAWDKIKSRFGAEIRAVLVSAPVA